MPVAELSLNVQSVTVGLLPKLLTIPPPEVLAVFPLKVQMVTIGLLMPSLYIPPPKSAEFARP